MRLAPRWHDPVVVLAFLLVIGQAISMLVFVAYDSEVLGFFVALSGTITPIAARGISGRNSDAG